MNKQRQNEFDRIAASRISKINGGIPKHIALSNVRSITLRNKLNRMGLSGKHIDSAINMVDEIGLQGVLEHQSLGVRFSTMAQAKRSPKIWKA
jgi:hypothetical protein